MSLDRDNRFLPWCAAPLLLAAALAGCSKDTELPTLQGLIKKIMPPPPKKQVAMMFNVEDPDARREGIEGLASRSRGLKEPYLKAYARALATDREPLVRSAAVRALGKAGDAKYLLSIVKALDDEEMCVRWDAAVALDSVTGEPAIDPLRKRAVEDPSVDVRAAAIQALRHYNKPRVINTLVRCLSDGEFTVRHRAHEVLVKVSGVDKGPSPAGWLAGADEKPEPAKKTAAKKPWWKRMFSRSPGSDDRADEEVKAAGAPAGKPIKPTRRLEPWWKFSRNKKQEPRPARTPAGPKKPWWDWLGVTGRKKSDRPAKKPSPPPTEAGPKRPWWDLAGVTGRKKSDRPTKRPSPPPAKTTSKRPWWDLAGVTGRKKSDRPAKKPSPPPAKTGSKRPWWDWLGVTRKKSSPAKPPATPPDKAVAQRRAKPPAKPAPAGDPSWDELANESGRKVRSKPGRKAPASRKPARRPWWDWFGITKKKDDAGR